MTSLAIRAERELRLPRRADAANESRAVVPKDDNPSVATASSLRERSGSAGIPAAGRRQGVLYIVVSPRPQVGKTFIARLLADFLRVERRAPRAFDLNPGGDALRDYLPAWTIAADIGDTRGQMALFDRLIEDDDSAKVVDVGHAAFERFFAIAGEIGFFDEARRHDVEPIVLFAADPHRSAVAAYADLQRRFPDLVLVPVFNEMILKGRNVREQYPFTREATVPLLITMLAPLLKSQMEIASYSFADVHDRMPTEIPVALGYELQTWTRRIFVAFREIDLRLLLEQLRPSLAQSRTTAATSPERSPAVNVLRK